MKTNARVLWLLIPVVLNGSQVSAQTLGSKSGEFAVASGPCISTTQRQEIQAQIAASIRSLEARGVIPRVRSAASVAFGWPVAAGNGLTDPGVHGISNFVDQNPSYPNLVLDYNCGTRSYDLSSGYNHSGTDIFSWPFGWYKMDHDQVVVVAAAPGTIVYKADGNYDRNCGFGSGYWNAVYVMHADGSVAWYGHMKNGSPTTKNDGDLVAQGEYLGVVGSSGNSTGPHLHFEVYDNASHLIDPHQGSCNSLNSDSWWAVQRPYYDSAINALMTHDAPPEFLSCPNSEIPHARDVFFPGEVAYFAAYYRDQLNGQISNYAVLDPNGAPQWSWSHASPASHYVASYWYWYVTLPSNAMTGEWTFRVVYLGQTYTHHSRVVSSTAVDDPIGSGDGLEILGARPNPGRGQLWLHYRLPQSGRARIALYDERGRRVATLLDETREAGPQALRWDGLDGAGRRVPSGVYFARLESAGAMRVKKIIVAQ